MSNYLILILLSFFMLISIAAGTQFKVGGSNGWSVPDTNATSYSQWAEKNRFKIGDSLLFVYLPDEDSVLLVNADAYNSCNTSSFVDFFNDGNTVFTFTRSSHFYFISGKKDNCDKNEKLVVVVMADRATVQAWHLLPFLLLLLLHLLRHLTEGWWRNQLLNPRQMGHLRGSLAWSAQLVLYLELCHMFSEVVFVCKVRIYCVLPI
ncbi:unnamed protein product [Musa textilis]